MQLNTKLKRIYWALCKAVQAGGRRSEVQEFLDAALNAIGVQTDQHWSRVVMDRETKLLVNQLKPENLKVLEISGHKWGALYSFREYKSLT